MDDQQHGYGVQRWFSGAVYCGKWVRNKEDGWGAYFCPSNTPSQHNPHSAQTLFLGEFQNGCPKDGIVIECMDFRKLLPENFAMQHEADAKDIHAQTFRVYEVSYDGVTAFWQLPVPIRKQGLFDLMVKLCEYEVRRVDKPLSHNQSLVDIWYNWIPNIKKEKKVIPSHSLDEDKEDDQIAGADPPALNNAAPKSMKFETFYFHGTCVRDKLGQFPCPKEGFLGIFPGIRGSPKNLRIQSSVEYEAKFSYGLNNSQTLQFVAGKEKYAVPADDCKIYIFHPFRICSL